MKSFIKLAMALATFDTTNAKSYWDNNSCSDVAVTIPANGTSAVVYFVGSDVKPKDNAGDYYYEWFRSELSTGTATQ